MGLSKSLQLTIEQKLNTTLQDIRPVGGGSINNAYRLQTNKGYFFIKTNSNPQALKMLETEATGLNLLKSSDCISIPAIIDYGEASNKTAYLLLEFVRTGIASANFWKNFARQLANLHQKTNPHFGLDHHNFIGRLPQSNSYSDTWTDFYINERLGPQVSLAKRSKYFSANTLNAFDKLYLELDSICPKEAPSLIHGDLWNCNYICGIKNEVFLIDPSIAYAHREMDIAMSQLFGGFSDIFYQIYQEVFPLEKGFEERCEIYQLYYLLVHVNMFGQSYVPSVEAILKRYS